MVISGSKDVTTAGTREKLAASYTPCFTVTIQAKVANSNYVYVGGSSVSSTNGVQLAAGDSVTFSPISREYRYDLSGIWVDAAVDGEGVVYIAEQEY